MHLEHHPDDIAVDLFAAAMKEKLAKARSKGRGGWDDPEQCTVDSLSQFLRSHVDKGDPVDVANFCMMLHHRGSGIERAGISDQNGSTAKWMTRKTRGGDITCKASSRNPEKTVGAKELS
jgi:hypothetical protein